jgi:ribosomal protein S18 acetylase RimI-like enzyme
MLDVHVREAARADDDGIAAVRASALATLRQMYRPNHIAVAHKQTIADTLIRLVAVFDGRVIGTVEYGVTTDGIHFLSLGVHSDYRGQGVAKQLVEELARIGKRAGATRLTTYAITQTGNLAIFERMGFRVISEEPSEFFESDRFETLTEAYMERPIN